MANRGTYILFVDDDEDDRDLVRECCAELARMTQAQFVTSGEELFRFLAAITDPQDYPSLIVLDVNMPGVDGKEALNRLKKDLRYRHIPVVMFTTGSRSATHYLTIGAEQFYSKPYTYQDLQRSVSSFFERLTPPSLS